MGSGTSTEVKPEVKPEEKPEVKPEENKAPNPVLEVTNSDMASHTETRDEVGELPKKGKKKTFLRRPSEMVRTISMRETEEEEALEQKILKVNPAMRKIFQGLSSDG